MSIPTVLAAGTLAVYGIGAKATTPQTAMPSGLILEENYRYGTVYQIWDGGQPYVYGGDVVYWKDGNQISRLVTQENTTYTILPAQLVTKDNLYIAP